MKKLNANKRNYFLTAVFCAWYAVMVGQVPDITMQATIGGNYGEQLTAIDYTPDGGYVMCGFSASTAGADKSETSLDFDYWVVKINAGGVIAWENTIIATGSDRIYDISTTPDGNYLLAGFTSGGIGGDKTEPGLGETDFWFMALDHNGNILWQKVLGGPLADEAESIIPLEDGGLLVAGSSWSGGTGDLTDPGNGQQDLCFFRLNADLEVVWQQTIGGNMYDAVQDVQATPDGGFIVAAYTCSWATGEKTEGPFGSWDYWILKLDADGNIEWQNSTGGEDVDRAYSVAVCADGGYIVNGESSSPVSGEKTEAVGGNDYWIVKFDALGNIMWQNAIGGDLNDCGTKIIPCMDGGFMAGGYAESGISGDKTDVLRGVQDYWVLKLDETGNIEWQKTIGGSGNDQLYDMLEVDSVTYFLAGWSVSGISYEKTQASKGSSDYWLMTISTEPISCPVPWVENMYVQPTKAAAFWNHTPEEIRVRARYRQQGTTTWSYSFNSAGKDFVVLRDLTCNTNYEYQIMRICAEDGSDYSAYGFMVYFNTPDCRENGSTAQDAMLVYPNPASNAITISTAPFIDMPTVNLLTLKGQSVPVEYAVSAETGTIVLNLEQVPSGIYQIELNIGDSAYREKIVVVK